MDLEAIVGTEQVLTNPDVRAQYEVDWTGRFAGSTPAVVRPGSVAEVAAVLAACDAEGIALVPQGGNTGLVGGSVPLHDELVLSLRRLDGIGDVDRAAAQVTVGAGATLGAVQAAVAASGLEVGVDLAARDSATIGGMVATNAGGTRVLRHGHVRASVAGVEAVLADGRVISHLGGLIKDNTGYDLAGLLTGSEGTLAVVTAVRLRLVPRYEARCTALVGFASLGDAVAAVADARRRLPHLDAAEVVFSEGLALVATHLGGRPPVDAPVVVLLECAAHADPTAELATVVDAMGALDVAVATEPRPRAELWRWREAHTEAIAAAGTPVKLDVAVPLGALARFEPEVRTTVAAAAPGATTVLFGHIGDGNLHVNVLGALDKADAVEEAVLRLVASMGGSISAEHGIGTAKKRWLHLQRSPAEIDVFRSIKRALDPNGILHPYCLLPGDR